MHKMIQFFIETATTKCLQQIHLWKNIEETFETDYLGSLSSHFAYWKSKVIIFLLDLTCCLTELEPYDYRSPEGAANNVTKIHSNRERVAEGMLWFIDGLFLIVKKFSFCSKKYFLFS